MENESFFKNYFPKNYLIFFMFGSNLNELENYLFFILEKLEKYLLRIEPHIYNSTIREFTS